MLFLLHYLKKKEPNLVVGAGCVAGRSGVSRGASLGAGRGGAGAGCDGRWWRWDGRWL